MPEQTMTLGDTLPAEMARVRDEVLPVYDRLPGGVGQFAATLMRKDLDAAARALAEGDVVLMLEIHEELKGWRI